MSNLLFFADYTTSGVGTAPSSPPTVTVYSVNRSTGAEAAAIIAAATTASALAGRYYYQLASANLQTYDYHGRFHTSDATVDSQDQPALWTRYSEAVATDSNGGVNSTQFGGQVVTAGAPVTVPASIGTSTYAGADTTGTTTLLGRIPGTIAANGSGFTSIPYTGPGVGAIQSGLATLAGQAALSSQIGTPAGASISADIQTRSTFAGGAVASVTSPVTVGTNGDKSGYLLATAPPTAGAITTSVVAGMANAPVGSVANLSGIALSGGTVASSPAPTSTTFTATGNLNTTNGGYASAPMAILWQTGANAGFRYPIASHAVSGSAHAFVVTGTMPNVPSATDTFVIG